MEIIGLRMDDNGPADDFFYGEPCCDNRAPCQSFVYKYRGQVACMRRMRAVFRVKMSTGISKRVLTVSGTGSSLVDVEAQHRMQAVSIAVRKTIKRGSNE